MGKEEGEEWWVGVESEPLTAAVAANGCPAAPSPTARKEQLVGLGSRAAGVDEEMGVDEEDEEDEEGVEGSMERGRLGCDQSGLIRSWLPQRLSAH